MTTRKDGTKRTTANNLCPSCDRDVTKMHPDYRGRMANGKMGHLEMDPKTGATILVEERS